MSDSQHNPIDRRASLQEPWSHYAEPIASPSSPESMAQMTQRLQMVIDAAERAAQAIRYDAEEQARQHLAAAQRKADQLTAERVQLISELTDDLIRHAAVVRQHSEQMVHGLEDAISVVTDRLEQPLLEAADAFQPEAPLDVAPSEPAAVAATEEAFDPAADPTALEDAPAAGHEDEAEPPEIPTAGQDSPAGEESGYGPASVEGDAVPGRIEGWLEQGSGRPVSSGPPSGPPAAPWEVEQGLESDLEPSPAPLDAEADVEEQPEVSPEALLHATRLAVGGSDREAIAVALREEFGIADTKPITDHVLGPA